MSIAKIIATENFAEGGLVGGSSPHKRADNIPARLTAGEFVHNVDAVSHYGRDFMEAVNRRMVPKHFTDAISRNFQFSLPKTSRNFHFAEGGIVPEAETPAPSQGQGAVLNQTIFNIVDPSVVDSYMASDAGKDRLLNVMKAHAYSFRNVLEVN